MRARRVESSIARERRAKRPTSLFVGRERELAELRASLEEARDGHLRLFLVTGESGIGKTRLADELVTHAIAYRAQAFWGRCWEDGSAPAYWPWIQIIRDGVAASPSRGRLRGLGPGAAYLAEVIPEIAARLDPPQRVPRDPEEARFLLFDAMATLLRKLAGRSPLVLVLDDLHWADRPSLIFLSFVARHLADAAILIVGTVRDAEARLAPEIDELLADVGRLGHRLPLRGLDCDEVAQLIGRVGDASEAVVSAVHQATGGNPFFVDEVARLLAAEGGLANAREVRDSKLAIPDGVRDAIRRRVAFLPEEGRRLLALAAVLGREFELAWLRPLSGLTHERVSDILERSADLGLTVPGGEPGRERFSHALMREALYESLPRVERARRHREIGEWIERLHAADLEPYLDELAHHFACGDGDRAEAIHYSVRAGERALRLLAYEEAIAHFERARQLLAPDHDREQRCDLLLALGEAYNYAGEPDRANAVLEEAAGVAQSLRDAHRVGRAALTYARGLVESAFESGHGGQAIRFLERAANSVSEPRLRSEILSRLATATAHFRSSEEAEGLSREAEALARDTGDPRIVLRALSARYAAARGPERLAERVDLARELIALTSESDFAIGLETYNLHVDALLEAGELGSAEREIDRYLRHAERKREPFYRCYGQLLKAAVGTAAGRFDEAGALIGEASATRLGFHETVTGRLSLDAARWFLDLHLGRVETVRRESERIAGLEIAGPARHVTLAGLAYLYAELGLEPDARGVFETFAAQDFADLSSEHRLLEIAVLAEAARFLDDAPRARQLYDLLIPYASRNVVRGGLIPYLWGPVPHSLGLLAATLGRWKDAIAHFEEAGDMARWMRMQPSVVRADHRLAETLLARDEVGDRDRGLALLESAASAARDLGMAAVAAKITALRSTAGTVPTSAPPHASHFRKDGEYWTIAYAGTLVRLKAINGLDYLAELLRAPGKEIHALELVGSAMVDGSSAGGQILDAKARAAYADRRAELAEELEDARARNDRGRIERCQAEIDALSAELAAAVGLGGRDRTIPSAAERARQAATKAIRKALRRISAVLPTLGRHLEDAVETGTWFRYRPDSAKRVDWRF